MNIACPGPLNCGDGARWRIFGVVGSCRKRNQLSRFASNDSRGRVTRKHQAHVDRFHTKFKTGRRTTGCTNARALGYMRWRADGIGRRALAGGAEFRASRAAEVVVSNRLDAQRTGLEYNNGGRFGSMGCSQISTHAPGTICTNERKRSPLSAMRQPLFPPASSANYREMSRCFHRTVDSSTVVLLSVACNSPVHQCAPPTVGAAAAEAQRGGCCCGCKACVQGQVFQRVQILHSRGSNPDPSTNDKKVA